MDQQPTIVTQENLEAMQSNHPVHSSNMENPTIGFTQN